MGTFGDSITTSPSYSAPLSWALNVPWVEVAQDGAPTSTLLSLMQASSLTASADESVILCGINDVNANVSAAVIEANLAAIGALVHNPHYVTILPYGNHVGWTSGRETVRQAVNDWIKANTSNYTDAEAAMGDLTMPSQPVLKSAYDSGDGLHPNDAGNTALAGAIFAQGFDSEALV